MSKHLRNVSMRASNRAQPRGTVLFQRAALDPRQQHLSQRSTTRQVFVGHRLARHELGRQQIRTIRRQAHAAQDHIHTIARGAR
jgi:hypothetical protein